MAVALNNIACIALFELTLAGIAANTGAAAGYWLPLVMAPLVQLGGAVLLGAGVRRRPR